MSLPCLNKVILSYPILSYPILSYPILSYPILSYPILSYPIKIPAIIRKNFTVPFLKYKRLKLKFSVFLAGHSVAMVTYCVTKIIPTCSPMIGQFFDTMIVASIDKEW